MLLKYSSLDADEAEHACDRQFVLAELEAEGDG